MKLLLLIPVSWIVLAGIGLVALLIVYRRENKSIQEDTKRRLWNAEQSQIGNEDLKGRLWGRSSQSNTSTTTGPLR